MDEFVIDSKNLGRISALSIGHDGGGITSGLFGGKLSSQAWLMDRAEILDQVSGANYTVACAQWFDKKKGDGKIERKLPAKFVEPRQ